jgi:cell division protein FtsW
VHRKSVYFLIVAIAVLIVIGCVMLGSTAAYSVIGPANPLAFVKKQFMWIGIAAFICVVAANVDYHFWQQTWVWWFALALVLLALCFVDPIGRPINGSRRWLQFGFANFQPSELAKLATIAALAWWYSRADVNPQSFARGFLMPIAIALPPLCLIAPEVDMGTTALIGATLFAIMFVAGTRLIFLAPVVAGGLGALIYVASMMPERVGRLLAFMDLEKHRLGSGLQQYQALIAFGSGGVEGLGLGNGRQKMAYLPEAHTDFIFSMIGEELGLRFTLLIVVCYVVIIVCGVLISMHARDRYGLLLGFGLVVIIALQAAVNIGVNTALLPNKGLPLPFVSYGGSNLVFCMLCIGILINIYRKGLTEKEIKHASLLRSRVRRPARLAVRI